MKIVMTTRAGGGVWTYTLELVRQLAALGCETTLAVERGRLGEAERIEAERLTNAVVREAPTAFSSFVARRSAWLARVADEVGADVIHLNDWTLPSEATTRPMVLVAHGCEFPSRWEAAVGDAGLRRREGVMAALEEADAIVAPTRAALADLRAVYGEADIDDRDCVIHYGIDPKRWPAGEHAGGFVLAAGTLLDASKNLRGLVDVAVSLPAQVVIAGDQREAMPRMSKVVMLGRTSRAQFARHCREAGVFAHPARRETSGFTVLEAALSGCPLVLGDIPSLRELWDEAAMFVDPDDEGALHAALQALLTDRAEARLLGEAARARAVRYRAREMALAYIELYAALLDQRFEVASLLAQGAA